jgi:hypothetical protein
MDFPTPFMPQQTTIPTLQFELLMMVVKAPETCGANIVK